jgi:hypothetical protein
MINHGRATYNDHKLRPFSFTKRLIGNHFRDESEIFIVYGTPMGIGKSAYVNYVLADVYGFMNCHDKDLLRWMNEEKPTPETPVWELDWKSVENRVFYLPKEVVDKCLFMLDHDVTDICFHWDDAGTWLYIMEWQDPFVVAFMEYLGLIRGNWKGGVILSTPIKEWILKKLQAAEGIFQIKITKPYSDDRYIFKPRDAICYEKQRYPGSSRPFYPKRFEDHFIGIMPDQFYDEWYEPRRRKYGLAAAMKMKSAIEKRKSKGYDTSEADQIYAEMKEQIQDANSKAVELREAVAQKTPLAH